MLQLVSKAGFFPHIQVFFLLFSTGSDPTQQTAIDNFMVHELVEPKMSGAGAIGDSREIFILCIYSIMKDEFDFLGFFFVYSLESM